MADEIKLKAPTVEQQVVVNINGEDKLKSFADTLDKISNNKNLQKYWKNQQDLINATADAYSNFQKKASKDNASELIKVTNALKAMSGTDLSHILPDFDKISKSMVEAQKIAGNIDSAFSVKGFKEAFDSFEALKAYGTDIQKLFSHFGVSSDIGELQQNVRLLEGEVEKLTRRLINAKNANEELRNEFENFKVGSGFADKLDELDRLKAEMQNIRDEATQTFNQFLDANKIDRYDWFGEDRFAEYFEQLENGTLTATNAIRRFKSEYAHLLEDSYRSSGNSFGLEQLQAFSTKLDSIFHQVEETAKKINDIISNGVIAKSVQNLSEDTTLSDSQRSIFGNILQDEEALKSIKSLFQKIVEESNNAKNTEIFNTEQFAKVETIFEHIESTLSSIKSVLVDVGEGEELSPLLKMLDDIRKAASNIKLGLNIDLGSEISEKLDQNVSQATQRQVTAYQKLLKEMFKAKSNKEMFDFYRNGIPENASNSELVGIYKGIIKRAEDAGKIGNTNIYKKKLGSVYDELKREIKNANAQLSRAETKRSENGILGDLFGNNTDLSGVIEQLNIIVSKLDEISESAKGFTEAFKDGLNVNASVEEIEKLTNRVKELEDELAKVKTPTVATAPQESNISLENNQKKDAFPKTSENIEQVAQSEQKVQQEAVATDKALDSISFTPNTEGFEDIIAKFGILREQAEQITKIVKTTKQTADGTDISYKATLKNGSSYYLGENSTPQVLNASETVYDARAVAKNAEQEAKEIQAEWGKNLKTIQDYMDAVTKLNNLKAKDKGTGREANQIALQTQNVEELKQAAWDARKNLSSMQAENPDIIAWKQWVDMMELFDQASKGSAESAAKLKDVLENIKPPSLDKYENKLFSFQTKTSSYDATIARFENGGWTSPEYLKNIQAVKDAVQKYETLLNKIKTEQNGIASETDIQTLKEYESEIKKTIATVTNMSAAQKGYSLVSGQKELDKIRQILKENSAMSAEAKGKIKAYYREIESGNPSMSLDKIHGEIMKIVNAEAEAGRAGKRMWDVIKEKAWYGAANVIGTYFGINDIFRYIQQGISTIRELDEAMTEVRKVSDATEASYAKFQKTIASTAKDIATTNKELLNSSADFLRLGYSLNQASELAKNATLFVNVGDGVDITEATEDMITAMKAFDIQAEDSIKIVDDYNQIGNQFALSATDIGEAMKRSASALETGNNSFEQSISLITAMNEIVQNSENTGNSLKVLSLRLRGAKAELEDMQEDTDGLCESTSKLREQIQSLTGVDIMIDDNTFKSTTDIIKELGAVWDKLSDSSQAATLELIAGKSRANNIAALLKNYQQIDKVMESLGDAEGSAMRENEDIVNSINGRIKTLSATAEEFWKSFISTDLVKNAVSFATSFLNIITKIIDKFGVLPSLITPIVAILSAKNKNFGKLA